MSEVRALVKAGDVEGCIAQLEAMKPKERTQAHAAAQALYNEMHDGERIDGKWIWNGTPEQRLAAAVAAMGTSTLTSFRKGEWGFPADEDVGIDALRRLRPNWLAEAAGILLEGSPFTWVRARRLIRAGLSDKPEGDAYILGLLCRGVHGRGRYETLRELIDDDPELLEDEIWRFFEVEGGGEFSLASYDKYSGGSGGWSGTLKDLADEGLVPRARLLDASLDALERDFAQFRVGWFSRFHEHLAPTVDERAERQARYMRLLSSPIPPTVKFALKALEQVDKAKLLDDDPLLQSASPALLARAKSTVRLALTLLANAARRDPERHGDVAVIVAGALAHEAVDVQKAVFDQLDALAQPGDPAVAEALAPFADGVAPSLRSRLAMWLGAEAAAPETTADEPTAVLLDRLDESSRIAPIVGVDELVAQLSYVLENADKMMEVERVLDGVSRIAVDAALAKPLLKRAHKIAEDQMGDIIRLELARLAIGWITGESSEPMRWKERREPALRLGLLERITALLDRIAGGDSVQLLSTPTHEGFWIDPETLVERIADRAERDIIDQVIALLRMAPEGREVAAKRAVELDSELGRALRHALGEDDIEVGPTAALWIAAARARAPYDDDPAVMKRHPGLGPDAAVAATFDWSVVHVERENYDYHELVAGLRPELPGEIPPAHVAVALAEPSTTLWSADQTVRYALTLWPGRRDGFFAVGARVLLSNSDWWSAHWENRHHLEPLCERHTPMNEMALLILAVGLAAKEPGEKGLAVDAMIAAVSEGRLDPVALGAVMARLLLSGQIKGARWATTLSEVANASERHAAAARTAILGSLRGDPAKLPRDAGKLLGVLHELLIAAGKPHGDEQARAFLGALKRGGKAGKLAKAIAKLT